MIVIIWTYRVPLASREAFIAAYGPEGDWAKLFKRAPEYLGTELLDNGGGYFASIDRWTSKDAYDAFKDTYAEEYRAIDDVSAGITGDEKLIGIFMAPEAYATR